MLCPPGAMESGSQGERGDDNNLESADLLLGELGAGGALGAQTLEPVGRYVNHRLHDLQGSADLRGRHLLAVGHPSSGAAAAAPATAAAAAVPPAPPPPPPAPARCRIAASGSSGGQAATLRRACLSYSPPHQESRSLPEPGRHLSTLTDHLGRMADEIRGQLHMIDPLE